MKLFYFKPKSYGQEAFVCAENKKQAIEFLKKRITNEVAGEDFTSDKIDDMIHCKNGYTIEEYPIGHVIFTEIA